MQEKDKLFKEGDTITFELTFSEYIRTHNDSADELNNLTLNFKMSGDSTVYKAKCTTLADKKLIFQYTVPSSSEKKIHNGKVVNMENNQNWATKGKRNQWLTVYRNGRKSYNPKSTKYPEMNNTSVIVDMAGNSVDWGSSAKGLNILISNTSPEISKVNVKARGGSESYVAAGTQLWTMLTFSKPVTNSSDSPQSWWKNLKLKTNIKSGSSYLYMTPINISAGNDTNAKNEINSVTFVLTVPDGAAVDGGDYVSFTDLSGQTIVDVFGNQYEGAIPAPIEKYTVDTEPPVINIADSAIFEPGSRVNFYIPIQVTDELSGLSPTNGGTREGTFSLTSDFPDFSYSYRVSATNSVDYSDDTLFRTGAAQDNKFTLMDDTQQYLHIRLNENELRDAKAIIMSLQLKIKASDVLLNEAESEEKEISMDIDFADSGFTKLSDQTVVEADGSVTGQQRIEITEPSGINAVSYQWVQQGAEMSDSEWISDEISDVSETDTTWTATFSIKGLSSDITYPYDLYIKAVDSKGNTTISQAFPTTVYAGGASFEYEAPTANTLALSHSLKLTYPDTDDRAITVTISTDTNGDGADDGSYTEALSGNPGEVIDVLSDKSFYGRVTVTMNCENTDSGITSSAQEVFYYAQQSGLTNEYHEVILTPVDETGAETSVELNDSYEGPESDALVKRSIAGSAIKADISDNMVYAPYGLETIVFEESYMRFYDMSTGADVSTVPLSKSNTNIIPLPSTLESGVSYGAEVVLSTLGYGTQAVANYEGIIFFDSEPELYGFDKVYRNTFYADGSEMIFESESSLWVADAEENTSPLMAEANVSALDRSGNEEDPMYSKAVFALEDKAMVSANVSNRAYIKIWNETLGETKDNAVWSELTNVSGSDLFTIEKTLVPQSASTGDETEIIITEGENAVRYCFITANGTQTSEQLLNVTASSALPSLGMNDSEYGTWASSITFTAEEFGKEDIEIFSYTEGTSDETMAAVENFISTGTVTIAENGYYSFGVSDGYQNITWYNYQVDTIDTTPPVIEEFYLQDYCQDTPEYALSADVADDLTPPEELLVYYTVDDDFAQDLGIADNDNILFDYTTITDIGETYGLVDLADGGGASYSTVEIDGMKKIYTTLNGIYPYETEDIESTTRSFTLHVQDKAGNEVTQTIEGLQSNQKPGLLSVSGEEGSEPMLEFSVPVILTSPRDIGEGYEDEYYEPYYSMYKMGNWIYKDGDYSVEYTDVWGNTGTADFTVDFFGDIYGIDVHKSESNFTNKNVTVTIDAMSNPHVYIQLQPAWDGEELPYEIIQQISDSEGNARKLILDVSGNCEIPFILEPYNPENTDEEYLRARSVTVNNIRKDPLEADVVYQAQNPVDENGETYGSVEAILTSLDGRSLIATEGDIVYTFTKGGSMEYTFRFRDEYGNEGELKAVCPYTITDAPEDALEAETDAPVYAYDVYINAFGAQTFVERYNANSTEALPYFGDSMTFVFSAIDESPVTYALKSAADGVSQNGNIVTVTKNTSFTMVITDYFGNKTEAEIVVDGKLDTLPQGMVIYENNTSNGSVRAFLNIGLEANKGRDVYVVGTGSLGYDASAGMYYRDFYENGSYIFNIADKYGVNAQITASVDRIDDSYPVGTLTLSAPGIFEGEAWKALDTSLTNQNVALTVSFTKSDDLTPAYIREVTPSIIDGKGDLNDISVTNYGDRAVVIFRENAKVSLEFTAANGRKGTLELPEISFIERNNPLVEISNTEQIKNGSAVTAIELTFKADRDVFFTNSGETGKVNSFEATQTHTRTITKNDTYNFRFIDRAGNITEIKDYVVNEINTQPPVLTLSDFNEPAEYTNKDLTVKAVLNVNGTIRHNGEDIAVTGNSPTILTLPFNGFFEIKATGENGLSTSKSISVTKIDKTAPVITPPDGTVYVALGGDYAAAVIEGINAYDSIGGDVTSTLKAVINGGNAIVQPGSYEVTYQATDPAGNIGTETGYLYVYGDEMINVYINSAYAAPGTLTVLDNTTEEVNITTDLGNEPHKLYYAKGIRTAAQMKYDGIEFNGSLALNKNTFYTIYIVTQDRETYIGRILIEE